MKKILVVDDDKDILEVVEIILNNSGFDVCKDSTGFEIPKIVKKYKPDLILLDINLPGKSGIEICNELKVIIQLPPILLFSAHANKDEAIKVCNAEGFIAKPFEIQDLVDTISFHMK